MRKLMIAFMILPVLVLAACQPAAPEPAVQAPPEAQPPAEPVQVPPVAPPEMSEQPPAEEVPPAPLENTPAPAGEGVNIEQRCFGLISAEEFSSICSREGKVVLTPKVSEGGCWMNIADHLDNKLTAGFTIVDWSKASEANREFDRGVNMRRTMGAVENKTVGERSYEYNEIARHNVVWVQGTFLTRFGAMTALCPADKLIEAAKKVDERLR